MERFYCKQVRVFSEDGSPVRNIFLYDPKNVIRKAIVTAAGELFPGDFLNDSVVIEKKEVKFTVWKFSGTQSMGSVAGPVCQAKIVNEGSVTYASFILAEKSLVGHEPKSLRLPLF